MSVAAAPEALDGVDPADVLAHLAESLREGDSVIAAEVVGANSERPLTLAADLGKLVAACPRCSDAPADYALVVETVLEGYLLHYATPRILDPEIDPDLALLAGDYLYARGLERLAGLGDMEAIGELSDLISLSAQLHAGASATAPDPLIPALWISSVLTIGIGPDDAHEQAKLALRAEDPAAGERLTEAIAGRPATLRPDELLKRIEKTVGFRSSNLG